MAAKSTVLALFVVAVLHPYASPAAATSRSHLFHSSRAVSPAARGLTNSVAPSRAPGIAAPRSVPDGAGGHYVMWSDTRDGDRDLFLLRVANTGAPAAGWPSDGVVVCNAPGDQAEGALFPDGANGVIVGWLDLRDDATQPDIYGQRVSSAGAAQWPANGIKLLDGSPLVAEVAGVPDGAGGVLVAWGMGPIGVRDIYALRITSAGTVAPGWDPGGEIVCNDPDDQGGIVLASDGSGGVVVAWLDFRDSGQHLYAQRLDAVGAPQWAANGLAIDDPSHTANFIATCPAGGGHTFLCWSSTGAMYAQRLDGAGAAQWAAGGVTLHPQSGDGTPAGDVHAVPDGVGGVVVGWVSQGLGIVGGIYAQRVNGSGAVQWGANGVAVVTLIEESPGDNDVVPDGAGGAYFAWEDWGSDDLAGQASIYAQRITPAGAVDWPAGGVPVTTASLGQYLPSVALDGAGGALVSWIDLRGVDAGIFTQRFTSGGVAQFGAGGAASFVSPGVQIGPMVVQTADGGALVVWSEKRSGQYDIRARKLDENGNPAGPSSLVCDTPGHQIATGFIDDGAGGGIVVWSTQTPAGPLHYAQRLDGNAAPMWTAGGVAVCTVQGFKSPPRLASDGSGGAIFAWSDDRLGYGDPNVFNPDIYAQRVNAAGVAQWTANGVAVCTNSWPQYDPSLATDGLGGAIIAWTEVRTTLYEVYAQRVDGNGVAQWLANGVAIAGFFPLGSFPIVTGSAAGGANSAIFLIREQTYDFVTYEPQDRLHAQKVDGAVRQWGTTGTGTLICDVASRVSLEQLIDDGAGGAYVAWSDDRNTVTDVFAQHVDVNGDVAWSANGNAVCDAASYQYLGGITRSGAETFVSWADYRSGEADVYAQRVNASGAGAWAPNGVVVSDAARGQYFAGFAPWKSATPDRLYVAWTDNRAGDERIAYVQRLDFSGVSQWTGDGVTGTEVTLASAEADAERVRLVWYASAQVTATVYRREGDGAWGAVGTAHTDGTGQIAYEDRDVEPGVRYGYRLGIRDGTSEVFRGEVWVEVPNTLALALDGLRPSPAVGDVVVSFTLPRADDARLEWLDLAGRLVRTDELAGLAPGRHAVRLGGAKVAPGVYVLRLTQGGSAVTARGAVMR